MTPNEKTGRRAWQGGKRIAPHLGLLALAAAYFSGSFDLGTGHGDEGFLNLNALRILQGEMPHRDFSCYYTGLIYYYHAWIFRILGVDYLSLRYGLFLPLIAIVLLTFSLARRLLLSPTLAFLAALATLGWGLPLWPMSYPSWYSLAAALASARLLLVGRPGTPALFGCGALAAISFLFKQPCGIYTALATWLAWILPGPGEPPPEKALPPPGIRRPAGLTLLGALGIASALTVRNLDPLQILFFLVPLWLTGGAAARGIVRGTSLRPVFWSPFLALAAGGAAILVPVVGFYLQRGAWSAFWQEFIMLGKVDLTHCPYPDQGGGSLLVTGWLWLPLLGVALGNRAATGAWEKPLRRVWAASFVPLAILLGARYQPLRMEVLAWQVFSGIFLLAPLLTLRLLLRGAGNSPFPASFRPAWVVLLHFQFFFLMSSHHAPPNYQLYQAPFGVLLSFFLAEQAGLRWQHGKSWPPAALGLCLLGGALFLYVRALTPEGGTPGETLRPLDPERAHVRVVASLARDFAAVKQRIGELVPRDEPIFIYSSQPHFYFLSFHPNPVRFAVIDQYHLAPDRRQAYEGIVETLERLRIRLVILDREYTQWPEEKILLDHVRTRFSPCGNVFRCQFWWRNR